MKIQNFEGFPKESIDFLWELRFNNNKEWFDLNRDRYKKVLKEPMDAFAKEMNELLSGLDSKLNTIPVVARANRDIRFSKNKAPYKDHKWVVFKPGIGSWQGKPAFYFEIAPEGFSYGMGFYDCESVVMQRFRKKVDANTLEFEKLIKRFEKQNLFHLEGDLYKRKFASDKSDKVMEWYQRKSIALISKTEMSELIYGREILKTVKEGFCFLIPYHKYFMSIVE